MQLDFRGRTRRRQVWLVLDPAGFVGLRARPAPSLPEAAAQRTERPGVRSPGWLSLSRFAARGA